MAATVAISQTSQGHRTVSAVVRVTGFLALVSLGLQYGFDAPVLPVGWLVGLQVMAVAAYVLTVVVSLVAAPSLAAALRMLKFDLALIVLGTLLLVGEAELTHTRILAVSSIYIGTIQVLLVLRFAAGVVRWNLEMSRRQLHPARLLVTSFIVVIVLGGLLLALPKAMTPSGRELVDGAVAARFVQAMFTATSATCVTGLVVCDTGTDFTRFGQIVILVLIQLGGLGIMISSSLFGLLAGRQLSLRQSLVLQDALSRHTVGRMGSAIKFIVAATVLCEGVGAVLCYPMFASVESFGDRVFHCVFHAISAFCNAGFALQADSLVVYRASWGVYISIMPLIVVGGLGFPVLQDLWGWGRSHFRRAATPAEASYRMAVPQTRSRPRYRLNLHTKLVLTMTVALIVVPAVLLFVFESHGGHNAPAGQVALDGAMSEMSWWARAEAALFQSVTTRTAGFNTAALDLENMSSASHVLMVLLMFVGGSPASTAGGVKTIAVALLFLGVIDTLRGRERVEAFGRTVSDDQVRRSAVVVVMMTAVVSAAVLLLCVTETAKLRAIVFEAVSACATVGLSTGLTGELTVVGKCVIMAAMFAGRLGPLTIMIALAGSRTPARYSYPTESVTIG